MKKTRFRLFLTWTIFLAASFFSMASPSRGAILYKSYLVKYDRGQEILCDPHIVGENDAVISLLSQKRELAQENFPEFLHLFRRLNPHIKDLDRIRPGEHIFIPIRKMNPGAFSHQPEGIITIPFVTISKVKKLIREHSDTHRIKRGECVSVLVARRFGAFGTDAYRLGIDLFQRANPGISDLDRVFVGQKVFLPRASITEESWFPSLLDPSGGLMEAEAFTTLESGLTEPYSRPTTKRQSESPTTPLARAAELLNARLIQKGRYFFPSQGDSDLELDLFRFPVLETEEGKKVILSETKLDEKIVYAIQSFWEEARTLLLPENASLEDVMDALSGAIPRISPHQSISFSDKGLDVTIRSRWMIARPNRSKSSIRQTAVSLIEDASSRLPETLIRYFSKHEIEVKEIDTDNDSKADLSKELKKAVMDPENRPPVVRIVHSSPRQVISEIVSAFGYAYTAGVTVSFPYGGLQVKARSDLVTGADGKMLLVDFEDLQGDAVKAITETGIPVLQFKKDSDGKGRLPLLFSSLGCPFSVNPTFPAVKSRPEPNVSLTFPGFLILRKSGEQTLITHDGIDADVLSFLRENGVRVVTVPLEGGWV